MLWDHRYNFDNPSERKCYCIKCDSYWRGENPDRPDEYEPLAVLIGRTNQACRIKVCQIKHNVEMEAISLEEALAGKRLPLQAPKKALEQATEEGAVSPKRALSEEASQPARAPKRQKQSAAEKEVLSSKAAPLEKPQPVQACKAREQTAAEKREISPENTLAVKPLSPRTSKPQKKAAIEKRVRSPKGTFAGKLLTAFTHMPRKLSAEKRAVSPEDSVDKTPLPSQTRKPRKQAPTEKRTENALAKALRFCRLSKSRVQAAVERSASSPEVTRADGLQSGQTSKSQDHAPAESRAGSPAGAPPEQPRSRPVSRPQQQASVEDPSSTLR